MRQSGVLDFILLGLIAQEPRSGYELRKVFVSTPMRHFSDSPGSIYPSLARLQKRSCIKAVREKGDNPRGRQRFAITPRGTDAFAQWVNAPIPDERNAVVDASNELMLRFSFADQAGALPAAIAIARALKTHLHAYAVELRALHDAMDSTGCATGPLALESGIRIFETQARWAHDTLMRLDEKG
jgi:DNA-binding PadR family transcriptional regulator